jgi:hypothetical protein
MRRHEGGVDIEDHDLAQVTVGDLRGRDPVG